MSILQFTANQIYPMNIRKSKERNRYKHPWITPGILKSRDHKFFLLHRSNRLQTAEARNEYNKFRNKFRHIIQSAKKQYHGKGFEDIGNDVKKIWRKINDMKSNQVKSASNFPEQLKHGDPSITLKDPVDIANHLNKHFVEKGPKLANQLPSTSSSIYKSMGPRNPNSMSFDVITCDEVVNIVHEFENKKSCGSDDIPAILIKWSINLISPILTQIFNKFVELGVYPDLT